MRLIIAFIFLGFAFPSLAQTDSLPFKYNHWEPNFKNYTKMKRQQSLYCIETLKDKGALVVRLKTRNLKVAALRAEGFTSDADRVEAEQNQLNKNIVKAFRSSYNFSKVYFFFNDNTELLKEGMRKGFFLNDELVVDPTIELTEDFYLIAEFDNVESDPIGYPSKEEMEHVVVRPSIMNGRALVVRDKYFIQLRHPFPFYVMAPDDDNISFYVEKLDVNLMTFYNNRYDVNFISPRITLFWFSKKTDKIEPYYED